MNLTHSKAQLKLSFVNQRLEASEQDNDEVEAGGIVALKAELKESRDQMNQVWREVTDKLVSLARAQ